MLILIYEFELRGSEPLVVHVLLQLFIFMKKQKSSSGLLFTAKILHEAKHLAFSPGPNHLLNLTPKCKILSVFWTRIVSKRRIEQFFQLAFKCS